MARVELSTGQVNPMGPISHDDEVTIEFDMGDMRLTVTFKVRIILKGHESAKADLDPVRYEWSVVSAKAANRIIPTLNLWR
jgi:hypothetical protein